MQLVATSNNPKNNRRNFVTSNQDKTNKKVSYNALIRDLKNGKEYNALFPTPKNKKVVLGNGDTHTSIKLIIDWALKSNHEVKLVAPKLQKSSLDATCFSIHDFLFNHFQYKADGEAQLLRSPARAWKDRYDGIDCKSYSIIASCILLQLGIKHYIRKIKQPAFAPENFTHVYVIVPANQTTGSLASGYYTIDGTLRSTQEPQYIDKKDFFMDKLAHYGLNGVATEQGLNGFSYEDVRSLFAGLDCIGGSAYTDGLLKQNIQNVNTLFSNIVEDLNNDVKFNSAQKLGEYYSEFKAHAIILKKSWIAKKGDKSWNSCTTSNFNATIKFMDFYVNIGDVALKQWIDTYFETSQLNVGTFVLKNDTDQNSLEVKYHLWGATRRTGLVENIPYNKYSKKDITIKAFELSQYLVDSVKTNTFDIKKLLDLTSTVLVTFSGNNNGSNTGNNPVDQNAEIVYDENNKPKTQNAGMGFLFGGLALIGFAVWGFSKLKDTGK